MNRHSPLFALLAAASMSAGAHVTLPPGGATAGTEYPAAFRVGHACKDAQTTTAIRVRVPAGFSPLEAQPRPGWTVSLTPTEVVWTAQGPGAALQGQDRARFTVRGKLTDTPGTLWFKVLQVCDKGSADWSEVPAAAGDKPAYPAARLDVLPAGVAPVDLRDAWVRSTVTGQTATGVFGKLTSGAGGRLVGASSPWAEAVEVHEMKMDGNVMRMRALADGLELPPGETVELRSGGHHLMVLGLKRPLANDHELPLVLRFADRDGRVSERSVTVRARVGARGSEAEDQHQHHQHHQPAK